MIKSPGYFFVWFLLVLLPSETAYGQSNGQTKAQAELNFETSLAQDTETQEPIGILFSVLNDSGTTVCIVQSDFPFYSVNASLSIQDTTSKEPVTVGGYQPSTDPTPDADNLHVMVKHGQTADAYFSLEKYQFPFLGGEFTIRHTIRWAFCDAIESTEMSKAYKQSLLKHERMIFRNRLKFWK